MHYSVESKESKSKDSIRNKKDGKGCERKISAKNGSSSKSGGKTTPKHSKDKRQSLANK